MTLKSGGAHLDFRSRDGMTALHKAARAKNQIALKVIPPHPKWPYEFIASVIVNFIC